MLKYLKIEIHGTRNFNQGWQENIHFQFVIQIFSHYNLEVIFFKKCYLKVITEKR